METTSSINNKISLLDWLLGLGAGIISLILYIRTLAPGVLPGDSGEFQVLAHQLGIAHCPGYPIYLLMAKGFTLIPVGEIAYRVNLFSAFMAAITVTGIYFLARLISTNRLGALFGALVFSVSFTFWSQAVIAEVYTAGAAFAVSILICVVGWQKNRKASLLFTAGILGGLSLGVHPTVAGLAPGILVFLWLHRKEQPKIWQTALIGSIIGILIWFFSFILLDWNYPPANIFNGAYETARSAWGLSQSDIQNASTRIWFIASAQQWRSALQFNSNEMLNQAGWYFSRLPREFSVITLFFSALGAGYLILRRKDIAALLWISLGIHWLISFNYRIGDIYVFYITGYIFLAIFAAIGLDLIGKWCCQVNSKWGTAIQVCTSLFVITFSVSNALSPWWSAVVKNDVPFIGTENYLLWEDPSQAANAASNTVEQMEPDAIFFMDWYWLYVYYYAAHIEQDRLDLRFIETNPRSDTPGLPHSVIEFIETNIDSRPIYFSNPEPTIQQAGFDFHRREIWFSTFYKVIRSE